jgi:hypothetical protein
MKYIGPAILLFCGVLVLYEAANAAESAVPRPFQRFDANSPHTINYDDLTALLNTVVVDVGRSTREAAAPSRVPTGTRMRTKVQRSTVNEGNRFYFETFVDNEAAQRWLGNIKNSLEQVPADVPLEKFSRDEQLAYWLNLYNVTVLHEIVGVYPRRNLKKMLQGKKSILSKKLLTVAGIPLSLNDIQFTILKQNYDSNPLIIYGLYQGNIGGPDIRTVAYTGANVYDALTDNAIVFINSNRGTVSKDAGTFRVSSFYARNKDYFPDFASDLTAHLLEYLEGPERAALQAAATLSPDIDDWTVTDLGGSHREIGGSMARSGAALMNSVGSASGSSANSGTASAGARSSSTGRISPELLEAMRDRDEKEETKDTEGAAAEPGTDPVSESSDKK